MKLVCIFPVFCYEGVCPGVTELRREGLVTKLNI